jgi:hypothetical protein
MIMILGDGRVLADADNQLKISRLEIGIPLDPVSNPRNSALDCASSDEEM